MADLTTPLAKSVRTGEGILVYVTNAVLALAAILPSGLSWTHAGLYLVILNGVHAFQRGLLKAVAIASGYGLSPIAPNPKEVPELPTVPESQLDVGPPAATDSVERPAAGWPSPEVPKPDAATQTQP